MNQEALIESGNLELYVFGTLEKEERKKIAEISIENKEIADEIVSIENAILTLSSSFSPPLSASIHTKICEVLFKKPKSFTLFSWYNVAASILLIISFGIGYTSFYNSKEAENKLILEKRHHLTLEQKMLKNEKKQAIAISIYENKQFKIIELSGQKYGPNANATIYWNPKTHETFINQRNLPSPPKGMVYQLWSLKLNPLTATNMGTLDAKQNYVTDALYKTSLTKNPEAFGITLEPIGGSVTPTLEKLVVLGKV